MFQKISNNFKPMSHLMSMLFFSFFLIVMTTGKGPAIAQGNEIEHIASWDYSEGQEAVERKVTVNSYGKEKLITIQVDNFLGEEFRAYQFSVDKYGEKENGNILMIRGWKWTSEKGSEEVLPRSSVPEFLHEHEEARFKILDSHEGNDEPSKTQSYLIELNKVPVLVVYQIRAFVEGTGGNWGISQGKHVSSSGRIERIVFPGRQVVFEKASWRRRDPQGYTRIVVNMGDEFDPEALFK